MVQSVTAFQERFGMPGTCGVIDGTHIEILAPSVDEWSYVNRKGTHSVQAQVNYIAKRHCA